MIGQTAGRIVVFYIASNHQDLRWYLSIHLPAALENSANDPGGNVYTRVMPRRRSPSVQPFCE